MLQDFNLAAPKMPENSEDLANSEYVLRVEWVASVPREEAKWQSNAGLFTTPLVRASLDRQPTTVAFVESSFGVRLQELAT